MGEFRDYLMKCEIKEMAQALEGDWLIMDDLGYKPIQVLQKEYNYVEDLYGMKLYKSKSSNVWILGSFKNTVDQDVERFGITFRIDFNNADNVGAKFG